MEKTETFDPGTGPDPLDWFPSPLIQERGIQALLPQLDDRVFNQPREKMCPVGCLCSVCTTRVDSHD